MYVSGRKWITMGISTDSGDNSLGYSFSSTRFVRPATHLLALVALPKRTMPKQLRGFQ